MKHITPTDNTDVYFIKSDKFKTFSVYFHLITNLEEKSVSKNALFPFLLKQGCEKYPDMKSLNAQLQRYYGGVFDASVRKKGDNQIIDFRFEFLREKFCEEGHTKKVFEFIKNVLFEPLVMDGGFKKEYVDREKHNLIDYINGIINDKKEYTSIRIVEEMYKGDPYALFEYGNTKDIEKLDGKTLYEQYEKVMKNAPLAVFVHGDIDENEFLNYFNEFLTQKREKISKTKIYNKNLDKPEVIKENQNLVQGKFALGFQTDVKSESEDYYAFTLLNGVFGSGPTSKLFMNVREKMSLCYYVYSRLCRMKGTMYVAIGTDSDKFKAAYDEIFKQLDDCKNGNITEDEIDFARKFIISVLKQTQDSQRGICEYYLNGMLCNKMITPDEFIERIEKLKKEDIITAAKKIKLCTEYYLQ